MWHTCAHLELAASCRSWIGHPTVRCVGLWYPPPNAKTGLGCRVGRTCTHVKPAALLSDGLADHVLMARCVRFRGAQGYDCRGRGPGRKCAGAMV